MAQVLVDRLLADPVITRKHGFRNTAAGALDQLGRPIQRKGLLPPLVDAALVGPGNAFPLSFPNKGALEFGKSTHDREHEVGHGGSPRP